MKVAAKALLADSQNNLLSLTRSETHPHLAGHLDLPGGLVDSNESWTEAVSREVSEETGIVVDTSGLGKLLEIQHDDIIHLLYYTRLTVELPAITLSWEHSDYSWVRLNKLISTPLPKGVDRYYKDVINFLKSNPNLPS